MHLHYLLSVSTLLVATVFAQVSTKSFVACLTKQGTTSTSPVKTTSRVLTIPLYAYKTVVSTPSTIITPPATTSQVTATTTTTTTSTLAAETGTITETSTTTSTSTSIETAYTTTAFSTDSITTIYTTTTVATTAGFIAVETSLPNSKRKRESRPEAEVIPAEALEARQDALPLKISLINGQVVYDKPVYPQSVLCAGLVAVISTSTRTKTATTTTTITATTPTSYTTTTSTATATSTITPPAVTETVTTTSSTSTTTTSTTTSTVSTTITNTQTVNAPGATVYAACTADNNIAGTIGSNIITQVSVTYTYFTTANSAYDCCALCFSNPGGCAGSLYFTGRTCQLSLPPTGLGCSQSNSYIQAKGDTPGGQANARFFVSNGNCGVVTPF